METSLAQSNPMLTTATATVGSKVKEAGEDIMQKKPMGKAAELRGEAKGKASELSGEAKGKASEWAGKAKGKAEEVQKKL